MDENIFITSITPETGFLKHLFAIKISASLIKNRNAEISNEEEILAAALKIANIQPKNEKDISASSTRINTGFLSQYTFPHSTYSANSIRTVCKKPQTKQKILPRLV